MHYLNFGLTTLTPFGLKARGGLRFAFCAQMVPQYVHHILRQSSPLILTLIPDANSTI